MTGRARQVGAALALGIAALGCGGDGAEVVRGRGPIVQERRVLRPVDEVVVLGDVDLALRVVGDGERPLPAHASGLESVLWIEAPEDLLHLVVEEVAGGRLTIGRRHGPRLDPAPSMELTVSRLRVLEVAGSGEVRLRAGDGAATGPPLLDRLWLSVRGSVDVRASGRVGPLRVEHGGAGALHLGELLAGELEYRSDGGGDAWVRVDGPARVALEGSGDLHLAGRIRVESQRVTGPGRVVREPAAVRSTRPAGAR